jgi:hypothetical protein
MFNTVAPEAPSFMIKAGLPEAFVFIYTPLILEGPAKKAPVAVLVKAFTSEPAILFSFLKERG